jgi:lysozyme
MRWWLLLILVVCVVIVARCNMVINGKPVVQRGKEQLSAVYQRKCNQRDKALAWVDRNIKVPLTAPQKVGIASFCPYNIGPGKCYPLRSTNESMPVTAEARVKRSVGGLKTEAATAG